MLHLCISLSRPRISNKVVSSLSITPLECLCYIEIQEKMPWIHVSGPLYPFWSKPTPVSLPQDLDCVWHVNSISLNQALSKHKQPTLDTAQTCLSGGTHCYRLSAKCRDTEADDTWCNDSSSLARLHGKIRLSILGTYCSSVFRAVPSVLLLCKLLGLYFALWSLWHCLVKSLHKS